MYKAEEIIGKIKYYHITSYTSALDGIVDKHMEVNLKEIKRTYDYIEVER